MTQAPKITQEMIDLYDEYTHLTLDRRGFMAKLSRLAGSAAAAAAIVPLIASNYAQATIVPPDDPRLAIGDVTYPGGAGDGEGLSRDAGRARPASFPASWWSTRTAASTRTSRTSTRRLALEGFVALAVDLLSRQGGTPATDEEAAKMFQGIDRGGLVADAVAAVPYLAGREETNGKVGAVGFCFGGGIVNLMAVNSPELAAAVAYYGAQPPADDVAKIKARLMLHYAGLDQRIDAGIPAYEAALKAAGVDYQLFVYEGVNHAFNNDTSAARYDKAAAELAWSRTVAFFRETLSG